MGAIVYELTDPTGRVALRVNLDGLIEFPISGTAITPAGGFARAYVNKTGSPSVRGTIVTAGSVENSVVAVTGGVPSAIGAVYCNGKADGALCYVVTEGVAELLFADGESPTAGYWAGSHVTQNGLAEAKASLPDNSGAGVTMHNREIGHIIQTTTPVPGSSVLARVKLHFN